MPTKLIHSTPLHEAFMLYSMQKSAVYHSVAAWSCIRRVLYTHATRGCLHSTAMLQVRRVHSAIEVELTSIRVAGDERRKLPL